MESERRACCLKTLHTLLDSPATQLSGQINNTLPEDEIAVAEALMFAEEPEVAIAAARLLGAVAISQVQRERGLGEERGLVASALLEKVK